MGRELIAGVICDQWSHVGKVLFQLFRLLWSRSDQVLKSNLRLRKSVELWHDEDNESQCIWRKLIIEKVYTIWRKTLNWRVKTNDKGCLKNCDQPLVGGNKHQSLFFCWSRACFPDYFKGRVCRDGKRRKSFLNAYEQTTKWAHHLPVVPHNLGERCCSCCSLETEISLLCTSG